MLLNKSTVKLLGSAISRLTATSKGSLFAQLLTKLDNKGKDKEHLSKLSDAIEDKQTMQETPSRQLATTPSRQLVTTPALHLV
jgi:hypothetical protein